MSKPLTELDDATIIRITQRWLEQVVIGLNLCPYARAPHSQQRVRFRVSQATDDEELLADLQEELRALATISIEHVETVLLVHPWALNDFADYNEFLNAADGLLEEMRLDGEFQVASFHPDYQFADSYPEDIENATNRSPFPILHLLREASISRAIDAGADTEAIYQRNMDVMRKLGIEGWQRLMQSVLSGDSAPPGET